MIRNRDTSSSPSSSNNHSRNNHAITDTPSKAASRKKKTVSTTRDELFSFAKLLLVFLLCGCFVAGIQKKLLWNDLVVNDDDLVETLLFEEEIREEEQRLLLTIPDTNGNNDFPTLHYALRCSDLVVLYYAAVWCPISNAVTDQLEENFGGDHPDVHDLSLLLPKNHNSKQQNDSNKKKRLSILYVSSDKTLEAYKTHKRETSGWMIPVPYNSQEQEGLKKHFKVWSKPEVEKFMPDERRHEIPSIIVLSTKTQSIITTEGVEHVVDYGENVVNFWEDLVKEEQVYQAKTRTKQQ